MIRRYYVEKRPEHATKAHALLAEAHDFLGLSGLTNVRIFHRYDVDGLNEEVAARAVDTVFSDPVVDQVFDALPLQGVLTIGVEPLPGQFDQRADSAELCLRLLAQVDHPVVRTATIYVFEGTLDDEGAKKLKNHLINPVETREASAALPETLEPAHGAPHPVETLEGFLNASPAELETLRRTKGLAMDLDDLKFAQSYFRDEHRDPTETELRMIDTYWSDHCRHTTFSTIIDDVTFEDPLLEEAYASYLALRAETGDTKPVCLMDIAVLGARALKQAGRLNRLDESEEINACTVNIDVTIDGKKEPWLLLFKNETHNHPTEIEPFGGASTCIGGAIRDPLSGRSYVYAAMRVTGAADPRQSLSDTLPGKLPQRKIVTDAAQGYASYGNQIGLATGMVHELYHPGYAAKRLEIGAVVGAAPKNHVIRETPAPGDQVVLLGGRTGRDGIGGATGSSKAHTLHSVETAGAEVQKGNAPEERKLQRFFRNGEAARLIKRCNDFGAGGVSVAIGELAPGLHINLDLIPKKYEGLNGTELAISESQERMAAVVAPEDLSHFLKLAAEENLEATPVAEVTADPHLVMEWRGTTIVDISRAFLDTNGASKHISIPTGKAVWQPTSHTTASPDASLDEVVRRRASSLAMADQHGLVDRFDSTIGQATVLMPYGGTYHATPIQAMVHQVALEQGHTDTCSFMSWGFSPEITEKSPYHGAYLAVVESVAKLLATGATLPETYLSFQEYFKRPGTDGARWAEPLEALLGSLQAQMDLGIAAIGGKDSMSGTFEQMDVPPTLVSFAITTDSADRVRTPEWKDAGHIISLLIPATGASGLPTKASLETAFSSAQDAGSQWLSAYALGDGGALDAILLSAAGNRIGLKLNADCTPSLLTTPYIGGFLIESEQALSPIAGVQILTIGTTQKSYTLTQSNSLGNDLTIDLAEMESLRKKTLSHVYPTVPEQQPSVLSDRARDALILAAAAPHHAPEHAPETFHEANHAPVHVVIPVFPGTNCEVDSARYVSDAGLKPEIVLVRNLTTDDIARSVERMSEAIRHAGVLFLPGGFSGGDEPEGSAKLINAFFRNPQLTEAITDLMEHRGGLILGICNGFQALVKLGLLPFGHIMAPGSDLATLTYNTIGRHQSQIVRTRIVSNDSPWLSLATPGEVYGVAISHGEGRIDMAPDALDALFRTGRIAAQYVDRDDQPTMDIAFNPNGSLGAVEALLSPDGRILGKMGHSERVGANLYKNVPDVRDLRLFEAARAYFKKN